MKSVYITVPNVHWIHQHVVEKLLWLLMDKRYRLKVNLPSRKPYENNLNHIVNEFMESGFDYWLNIDSDNPPRNNPLDLIKWDKDIMGLPTPVWHYANQKKGERPVYWTAFDLAPEEGKVVNIDNGKVELKRGYKEHPIREGLQKVDAIGTGCFIIARRVFENPEMRKTPFTRKLNPDGTVEKGNDISFCERARENGFEIYAHYDYPCNHFSELELNKMVEAFKNLYE